MNLLTKRVWLDILDRAARSTMQKFLIVAFAATPGVHAISHIPWYQALGVGAGAGVISVLMSLASLKVPVLPFWPDLGVRALRSFVQSLLVTWGAGGLDVFHTSWGTALGMAVAMAGSSLVTGLIAARSPSSIDSASLAYDSAYAEAAETGKRIVNDVHDTSATEPVGGGITLSEPPLFDLAAEPEPTPASLSEDE